MFLLGLLLSICYIPGLTGAMIPTQWALLSIAGTFAIWRSGPISGYHILGLGFVAWAFLGLLWVPIPIDAIYSLWIVSLWALAFWLGTTLPSLTQLWKGLAWGLSISSIVAVMQWLGPSPVIVFNNNIAGLLYNRTILGASAALVILGLVGERLWWYIPTVIPGLILSGSRGGLLILTVGLLSRFIHWTLALACILTFALFATYHPNADDLMRLQVWAVAWHNVSLLGLGPGSFADAYYVHGHEIIHPEFVHNDPIQLLFEYGLFAVVGYIILARAAFASRSPAFLAFLALGLFYFPLYCPLTAFIGLILAGHALRNPTPLWHFSPSWRSYILSWRDEQLSDHGAARREAVSVLSRDSH